MGVDVLPIVYDGWLTEHSTAKGQLTGSRMAPVGRSRDDRSDG